jgi:hypothetical protein
LHGKLGAHVPRPCNPPDLISPAPQDDDTSPSGSGAGGLIGSARMVPLHRVHAAWRGAASSAANSRASAPRQVVAVACVPRACVSAMPRPEGRPEDRSHRSTTRPPWRAPSREGRIEASQQTDETQVIAPLIQLFRSLASAEVLEVGSRLVCEMSDHRETMTMRMAGAPRRVAARTEDDHAAVRARLS